MSILLGVGISLLTGLLLWINIQILIVSRSILNETITVRKETIWLRKISQVIQQESTDTRIALVGDEEEGREN
tara:strand:- start:4939 stop:5157 length:219 start_codon:yes stop_codon:yes gene_type:complete